MTDTVEEQLCFMPAHVLKKLFTERKLSPVDVLQAQIKRAERTEPEVNAFCETYFGEAMKAARESEDRYAGRASDGPRPLEGITVSIKDVLDHQGRINTMGSIMYRDTVAAQNHPVVQRVLDAGAIIHARTTTSEFAYGWTTSTRLWGTTRNPWNLDYTPGGSSGGAAASLAVGTSTLAIGADSAGSIRVPAAMCGVVGYKPPYGRVPDPVFGYDLYSVIGPLARTVQDCSMLQNVISGIHPDDIATLRDTVEIKDSDDRQIDFSDMRIAYSASVGNTAMSEDSETALADCVRELAARGATVEPVSLDWDTDSIEAGRLHCAHMFQAFFEDAMKHHGDDLCDYTRHTAETINRCDARKFVWTHQVAQKLYRGISPVLNRFDAFICPTVATNEVGAEQKPWEMMDINGVTVDSDFEWVSTVPFNILGQLPVLAVPTGLGANGVPLGVQVVGPAYDDQRTFDAAGLVESAIDDSGLKAAWPNL